MVFVSKGNALEEKKWSFKLGLNRWRRGQLGLNRWRRGGVEGEKVFRL